MNETTMCSRCGGDVLPVLSTPAGSKERWYRYRIGITRTEAVYRMRFRMFTVRWLPENPHDRLRETYSELDLCDPCARDVFAFAQGRENAS